MKNRIKNSDRFGWDRIICLHSAFIIYFWGIRKDDLADLFDN